MMIRPLSMKKKKINRDAMKLKYGKRLLKNMLMTILPNAIKLSQKNKNSTKNNNVKDSLPYKNNG